MTAPTAAELDALPYRTVVVAHNGMEWTRITTSGPAMWSSAFGLRTSDELLWSQGVAEVRGVVKAVSA